MIVMDSLGWQHLDATSYLTEYLKSKGAAKRKIAGKILSNPVVIHAEVGCYIA